MNEHDGVIEGRIQLCRSLPQFVLVVDIGTRFVVSDTDRLEGLQNRTKLPGDAQVHRERDKGGKGKDAKGEDQLPVLLVVQVTNPTAQLGAHAVKRIVEEGEIFFDSHGAEVGECMGFESDCIGLGN